MPYKDPEKRRQYQREYRARKKREKAAAAKAAAAPKKKYNCKKNRKARLKQYNLTIEDYDVLLKKQRYRCKCCGVHQDDTKFSLVVDHDHKTNDVRGLLCTKCNVGIGQLGDDLQGLLRAVKYLESYYEDKRSRKKAGSGVRGLSSRTSGRKMCSVPRQACSQEVLAAG